MKINGIEITESQSFILRVARANYPRHTWRESCREFEIELRNEGLGEDDRGKRMTKLYLDIISDVLKLMGVKAAMS